MKRPRMYKDITGMKFGYLTAIRFVGNECELGRANQRMAMWECRCECGNTTIVRGQSLRSGHARSCGCFARELVKKRLTTHGESRTKLHGIWASMLQRTCNAKDKGYRLYGARGITVCDDWHEFEKFAKWSKENGYKEGLTIDRIDGNKGYCPENCRWVTTVVQNNNRCNNRRVEINGTTKTLSEWAKHYGIKYQTVSSRINDRHWDVLKALTTPVRSRA